MNKSIITIVSGILGVVVLASPVLADSTISFSSENIDVTQGQNFALVVFVNPHDVKNGTVKLELEYPAELLEVKSFIFTDSWMSSFTDSEYDLIDNTNGILVKTAGYPGGISSAKIFGFVFFSTKETGTGVIKIGSNSFILDAKNENVLSETVVQAIVTIIAPVLTQPLAPIVTVQPEEIVLTEEETVLTEEEREEKEEEKGEEEEPMVDISNQIDKEPPAPQVGGQEETASFSAAIGNIVTLGTNSVVLGIIVVLTVLGIAGYGIYGFVQKRSRKRVK